MDVHLNKCQDCDRVIMSDETHHLCDICYEKYDLEIRLVEDAIKIHAYERPEVIAKHTHLTVDRVKHLLEDAKQAARGPESKEMCSNCSERNALIKSTYCWDCQLTVYHNLSTESRQAAQTDTGINSLRDIMGDKRRRTRAVRFRKPQQSVKSR
jgi:hypothetical protein